MSPRGEKVGNLSMMLAGPTATLEAEIEKCQVVCANCHRERAYGDAGRCR